VPDIKKRKLPFTPPPLSSNVLYRAFTQQFIVYSLQIPNRHPRSATRSFSDKKSIVVCLLRHHWWNRHTAILTRRN